MEGSKEGNLLIGVKIGMGGHGIPDSGGCLPGMGSPFKFVHNA